MIGRKTRHCGAVDCRRKYDRDRVRRFLREQKEKNGGVRYEDRYKHDVQCAGCGEVFRTRHNATRCRPCSLLLQQKSLARRSAEAAMNRAVHRRELERLRRLPVRVGPVRHCELPLRHPARSADWGSGRRWVAGICAWCDGHFVLADQLSARYCSKRCARQAERARSGRFSIPTRRRMAIYERDGWVCQLCHEPVDPRLSDEDAWAATLDHIACQSWTDAPDHSDANLRLAHRRCNSARGNRAHFGPDILAAA